MASSRSCLFSRKLGTLCAALAAVAWLASTAGASNAREGLADALVRPGATFFTPYRWEREPEVIALYFGADWCAPCHEFVPKLKAVYQQLRENGADTEVVFVSLDRSEREMLRYMRRQEMPWPAVDFRRLPFLTAIRKLAGDRPPNLVLIGRNGRVIANAWIDGHYVGPSVVLSEWVSLFQKPSEEGVAQQPASASHARLPR